MRLKNIINKLAGILLSYNLAISPVQSASFNNEISNEQYKNSESDLNHSPQTSGILTFEELEQSVDKDGYNIAYLTQPHKIGLIKNIEEYIKNNTISEEKMCDELKNEESVILADIHCFSKQREKMIEILKKIKRENLVVGLEIFSVEIQEHIDNYFNSKISLENLISRTRYTQGEMLRKYGYLRLLKFLKENNIKTLGIDMPSAITRELITDKYAGVSVKLYSGFDFFNRDLSAAGVISGNLSRGKNIIIIIGSAHAEKSHLPYMIEKTTSKKPVIVFQMPYRLSKSANPVEEYERFKRLGLGRGKVLKVNDEYKQFYLNIEPNLKEMEDYIKFQ